VQRKARCRSEEHTHSAAGMIAPKYPAKTATIKRSGGGTSVGEDLAARLAHGDSIGLAHDLSEACEGNGRSTGTFGHYVEVESEAERISW
jgi:hypothetical protein